MPFDPVFDLLDYAQATYDLSRRPWRSSADDGYVQYFWSKLFYARCRDERAGPAAPGKVRAPQPNKNISQQKEKARAADQIRARFEPEVRPGDPAAPVEPTSTELERGRRRPALERSGLDGRRRHGIRLPARGPPLGVGRPPGRPPPPPRPEASRPGPSPLWLAAARSTRPPPRPEPPASPRPTSSKGISTPPASPTARPSPPTPTTSRPATASPSWSRTPATPPRPSPRPASPRRPPPTTTPGPPPGRSSGDFVSPLCGWRSGKR